MIQPSSIRCSRGRFAITSGCTSAAACNQLAATSSCSARQRASPRFRLARRHRSRHFSRETTPPPMRLRTPSGSRCMDCASQTSCAASKISSLSSALKFAARPLHRWCNSAASISGAKFICLADYANSRGAADMGLYPDLLPGYHVVAELTKFQQEWGGLPAAAGLTHASKWLMARKAGKLKALYVVGVNPVGASRPCVLRYFSQSFVVVQDMFLTETAHYRRCCSARRQCLRKVRHLHQHLRRSADSEESRRSHRNEEPILK